MQRKKIYLACPYTHDDLDVRVIRFAIANRVAGHLMTQGHIIFSPISHTHPICLQHSLPYDYEYWKHYDEAFVDWCDEIYVATATGWESSTGVTAEVELATSQGKPVFYIDPISFEVTERR